MSIPFLNNITLNNNEIQNVRLQNAGSPPLNSGSGQIYFDSTLFPGPGDLTAKYYSNATDTWVSLKEYSFPAVIPANGYVTSTVAGTVPKPIITFDLNAVDGAAAAGERYLTKTNLWAEISTIPGTYNWNLSGETGGPTIILSGTGISIVGGQDLETTLSGTTLTVNLTVGPGLVGTNNNYISNQGIELADADDSIPFNSYTPGGNPPSTQVNVVKKTTFGTIPVEALTLVKNYIDSSVAGGLVYQGGYDADTNTPDLTTSPNSILKGWTYTVTVEGTFFGEQLRVGDVLIAEIDAPTSLADWTTVQNNIDFATAGTDTGAGAAVVGISRYDEDDFTVSSTGFVQLESTSKSGTITAGNLSGTVTHDFGINTIVQTISSSGDTVFCDVTRTATTSVATIAVAEVTDITILVQKIG